MGVTIRLKHLEQTLPGNMSLEMNIKFRHEHVAGILKFVSQDFSSKSISISIKFSSIFSNIRTFWFISTHTISIFKYSETSISIPSNYWWNFNIDLNYCEDQSVWRSIVTPLASCICLLFVVYIYYLKFGYSILLLFNWNL